MKLLHTLLAGFLILSVLAPLSEAAVDVSTAELQATSAAIFPAGNQLEVLPEYGPFVLVSNTKVEGGITAKYQARLLSDPWQEEQLPTLEVFVYSYSTQAGAHAAFESLSGGKSVWLEGENRLLHVNGDLIYEARLSGPLVSKTLLKQGIDFTKRNANILFPPRSFTFNLKSPTNSYVISNTLPRNGTLAFDLYVENLESAAGLLLSSSPLEKSVAGDFTWNLQKDGRLNLRFYSPSQKGLCGEKDGWLNLFSSNSLNPYEWNRFEWSYGATGLKFILNGNTEWTCASQQARSAKTVLLGSGAVGFVHDVQVLAATNSNGQTWDAIMQARPFVDVDAQDPDVQIFQALKNAGIFTGSDGYVYPDQTLNRAEAVKILLQAYKIPVRTGSQSKLKDVPYSAWFAPYVAVAEGIGLVQGTPEALFLPGNRLNRAEFFTFLMRMEGAKNTGPSLWADVPDDSWFLGAANWAKGAGLIAEDRFLSKKPVSRREAARAIYTLLYE
jgi:hypothetical protein